MFGVPERGGATVNYLMGVMLTTKICIKLMGVRDVVFMDKGDHGC